MKRLFSIMLLLMVTLFTFGQNNGQYVENNAVKIQYVGAHKTKVTNKQTCSVIIWVKYNSSNYYILLGAGQSQEFTTNDVGSFKAKATYKCADCDADLGWVEFQITGSLLPVKFVSLKAKSLGNNKLQVDFEIAEATNVNKFVIQVSFDGINWRDVGVVLPDNVQPNRLYSIKLDLSTQKQTK